MLKYSTWAHHKYWSNTNSIHPYQPIYDESEKFKACANSRECWLPTNHGYIWGIVEWKFLAHTINLPGKNESVPPTIQLSQWPSCHTHRKSLGEREHKSRSSEQDHCTICKSHQKRIGFTRWSSLVAYLRCVQRTMDGSCEGSSAQIDRENGAGTE